MDRDRVVVEDRTQTATLGEDVTQVAGEAVGEVDHCMKIDHFVERQGLGDPRSGLEMTPKQTAAKRAGDEDRVASFGAVTTNGATAGRLTQYGDGDDQRAVPCV